MALLRLTFLLWVLTTLNLRADCEKNLPSPPSKWYLGQENDVISGIQARREGVIVITVTSPIRSDFSVFVYEAHGARHELGQNSLTHRLGSSRFQLQTDAVKKGLGKILASVSMPSTSWTHEQMNERADSPQRKCRKGTTLLKDCQTIRARPATTHAYTTRKDGFKQHHSRGKMFPRYQTAVTAESFGHRVQQHVDSTEGMERPRHNRRGIDRKHINQCTNKKNATVRQKPVEDSCHVLFFQNETKLSAKNVTGQADLCSDEGTMGISHNESFEHEMVSFFYRCDLKNSYYQNQTGFGHDSSWISFYFTTMVIGNDELRHKLRPLFRALPQTKSIQALIHLIMESIRGTNNTENSPVTKNFHSDDVLDNDASENGKIPHLYNGRVSHSCGSKGTHESETEHKILSGSGNWRKDRCKKVSGVGLSKYFRGILARRPTVYTVFPASFLPTMGTSVRESMVHLGSRLASFNALPASCDISKVRLAEAGFYYDNSKTVRDASNVHEVVCYSCGLAYSQWKKGDNPVTIHSNLRPDCEHIRGRNASLSTPSASSGDAGQSAIPDSSTLSSGHGSFMTESSQGSSVPQSSLSTADSGIGTGSFSSEGASSQDYVANGMPEERRDGDRRSDGGDLATDCSSIPPTTLARPSNQSLSSGMSRDSAAPLKPSYQSSYSSSRDTSRARAQDLDDRPPLDMGCAVYPQFCRHQERRATFSTWPLANLFHPDDLVMQGFYYAGYADCLRCFYCGVGLKSWAEDDDVMLEHIRWRPSCGYVLNTKGRQFVQSVLNSLGQINSTGEQNESSRDSSNGTPQPSPAPETTNSPSNGTAAQNTTTTATQAPAARSLNASTSANTIASSASASASQPAATATIAPSSSGGNASKEVLKKVEDMGFSKGAIARAVRHFQQAGMTKTSVDALVEKILELDLEDNNATAANSAQREGLQTDGPEGASNYDLDADIQRAQRIISENARLKARQICKICKRSQVGMIFLPCGHILACTQCGSKTKNCTHCGEFIRATANVYLS